MVEAIANGVITGFGVVSGCASIASYISGFSLEKDVDQIKKSLEVLEDIKRDINQVCDKDDIILTKINDGIKQFYTNNKIKQEMIINDIYRLFKEQNKLFVCQQDIIMNALNEMNQILNSIKFNIGVPMNINNNFTRDIIIDPYRMGIHEFSPFDYSFVNNPGLITNNISPIIWSDTQHNMYYGKISKDVLNNYGFDVKTKMYSAKFEGYAYVSKYGLYLPDIKIR